MTQDGISMENKSTNPKAVAQDLLRDRVQNGRFPFQLVIVDDDGIWNRTIHDKGDWDSYNGKLGAKIAKAKTVEVRDVSATD